MQCQDNRLTDSRWARTSLRRQGERRADQGGARTLAERNAQLNLAPAHSKLLDAGPNPKHTRGLSVFEGVCCGTGGLSLKGPWHVRQSAPSRGAAANVAATLAAGQQGRGPIAASYARKAEVRRVEGHVGEGVAVTMTLLSCEAEASQRPLGCTLREAKQDTSAPNPHSGHRGTADTRSRRRCGRYASVSHRHSNVE
eukprot:6211081-Pleurochrysis_carterae.AAC.7